MVINSRRSEIEIIREILSLAKNGTRKTRILYQTNLSYTQLQNYLSYLIDKDVLRLDNSNSIKIYKTTEKGLDVIENINKVIRDLSLSV